MFSTSAPGSRDILLQGKNPGVSWEYTLPHSEKKPNYTWGVVRSDCSAPCAGGELHKTGSCTDGGQDVCSGGTIKFLCE
ncbi:hypothetical protein JZ751_019381 [Albula glossodonta]|uniref:Uncharacterized protein n=1 Tax=Albula glossodonta TaxID=121402 RepID=A0A8T2NM13_9TELE|nr:hypothetical protein JZ751_019381 [Albula glossodonta]